MDLGRSAGIKIKIKIKRIYVGGEDIRFLQNQQTPLKAGDEVSIVPAIAGG